MFISTYNISQIIDYDKKETIYAAIDDLSKLFGREKLYENLVLDIMNASKIVFSSKYERIIDQAHSEEDFIDLQTNQYIDVKAILNQKEFKDFATQSKRLMFFSKMCERSYCIIESLKEEKYDAPYIKEIEDFIIKKLEKHSTQYKDIFFLFLYPVILEKNDYCYYNYKTDFLEKLYQKISNRINGRNIYVITPTFSDSFYLRLLGTKEVEIITSEFLSKYIRWSKFTEVYDI